MLRRPGTEGLRERRATPIHNVKQPGAGCARHHSLIPSSRNSCRTAARFAPAALAAPRVSFVLLPPPRGDGGAPGGASLE